MDSSACSDTDSYIVAFVSVFYSGAHVVDNVARVQVGEVLPWSRTDDDIIGRCDVFWGESSQRLP